MNKIISKLLLAGNKLMYGIHLRQHMSRNNACAPFTKYKKRIQKVKETGDSIYIYQNEHAFSRIWLRKILPRRTTSN